MFYCGELFELIWGGTGSKYNVELIWDHMWRSTMNCGIKGIDIPYQCVDLVRKLDCYV